MNKKQQYPSNNILIKKFNKIFCSWGFKSIEYNSYSKNKKLGNNKYK